MIVIPALDLLDGKVVRLHQGDYGKQTTFAIDPVKQTHQYAKRNYKVLHLVDLSGARDGANEQAEMLANIASGFPGITQCGGGIRSQGDVQRLLDLGLSRVVVGTMFVKQPELMSQWVQKFGAERLVFAADCNQAGRIVSHGWTKNGPPIEPLLQKAQIAGIQNILCTVIERDGAMQGPDLNTYARLTKNFPGFDVQASGGIRNAQDIDQLQSIGLYGAIVGRALLEGAL